MPALLKQPKIHIILHLAESIRDYGPCSAFSAERYSNCYVLYKCAIFNSYFWCTVHIGLNLSTQWFEATIYLVIS